ncbi:hypothetical protein BD289DRAFT_8131 [Coniella lustricola]|uniref:Uncharacterized protein n=1 Tax=Coniella lustricola TaxID=2025994 RepID=A0A2T3AJQ2_9PEZI|nr:hypothetical protein BD289DRAFT_8131 [Coniella lustricola]
MSSPLEDGAKIEAVCGAPAHLAQVIQAPAAISWTEANSSPGLLCHDSTAHDHVTLDIYLDETLCTALLRVAVNVAYKGKRNKSNIFLFVCPEQIQNLTAVDCAFTTHLGTSTHTLEIVLSSPPSLVSPIAEWTPKNQDAQSVLSALYSLAAQTRFYIAFPSKTVSQDILASFCQQASTPGALRTMTAASNLAKLYGGQGGRVVEVNNHLDNSKSRSSQTGKETVADNEITRESPPSYNDLDSSSSLAPPIKRRRLDLGAEEAIQAKMSLEDICKQGFVEIGRRFDRVEKGLFDLTSRLDRMEQLVKQSCAAGGRARAQRNAEATSLEERMKTFEGRVTDVETRLEKGFKDVSDEIENTLYDVRHEFNDTISVRVEEEMGAAQTELEDFVKDEVRSVARDVEEVVKEQLRGALE